MGVGASLSSYTPMVFVMPLLSTAVAAMVMGSSILVSTVAIGPGLSSPRSTTGDAVAFSGCLPGYISSSPSI